MPVSGMKTAACALLVALSACHAKPPNVRNDMNGTAFTVMNRPQMLCGPYADVPPPTATCGVSFTMCEVSKDGHTLLQCVTKSTLPPENGVR
jgi:hypothetical protein